MSDTRHPYIKLDEIREVTDTEEANKLIRRGWVYLGFFARTTVPDFGTSHEKAWQSPVLILGDPSPDQDL
jgi:hypothetical protein